MVVFEKTGRENTDAALHIAIEAAVSRGYGIVAASNTGETVDRLLTLMAEAGASVPVVMVGQVDGFAAPGKNALSPEMRRSLKARGVRIVTAAHALSGAERGISRKFGGAYPVELVAHTLRMLGQGVKVCVESGLMALDCGSIEYGRPVVCVAGTGRGVDTVCILTPGYTASLFDTRVHEILCKPGLYTQEKTE